MSLAQQQPRESSFPVPDSPTDLLPDQQAGSSECQRQKELGNAAYKAGKHHAAITHYSRALELVTDKAQEAQLYSNRSAARSSLSQSIRQRPALLSELRALNGDDPTQLAALALKDAEKAAELMPGWHKAYSRKGLALFLMERYKDAEAAYQAGLALEPDNKVLLGGLQEVRALLKPAASPSGSDDVEMEGSSAKRPRIRSKVAADDCECTLCMKLLYEPVTTPCGHTFCKSCFLRAADHNNKCPMCRTIIHVGQELHVTVTLANLLSACFPEEYEARRVEEVEALQGAASDAAGAIYSVPVFVMSVVLPVETMMLNIFEPRYRLMVRRCMEGSRRFGMAQMNNEGEVDDVLVVVEIMECEREPDGRFLLEVAGRERVRMLQSWEQDGYRMMKVQSFSDDKVEGDEALAELAELSADVEKLMMAAAKKTGGLTSHTQRHIMQAVNNKPPAGKHEAISFWAAALLSRARLLPVSHLDLLRGTSTKARLEVCKNTLEMFSAHSFPCRFM